MYGIGGLFAFREIGLACLPDYLYIGFLQFGQGGDDGIVDCPCAKTSSDDKECFLIGTKVEVLCSLSPIASLQVLSDGVTCEYDFLLREEPFHALVGNADDSGIVPQDFVCDSCEPVLFLQEDRYSHLCGDLHGCSAGVSPYPNAYIGSEILNDAPCLPHTFEQVAEYGEIAP